MLSDPGMIGTVLCLLSIGEVTIITLAAQGGFAFTGYNAFLVKRWRATSHAPIVKGPMI
jgi:hypothetical protein